MGLLGQGDGFGLPGSAASPHLPGAGRVSTASPSLQPAGPFDSLCMMVFYYSLGAGESVLISTFWYIHLVSRSVIYYFVVYIRAA